jgi:hypothetical protein
MLSEPRSSGDGVCALRGEDTVVGVVNGEISRVSGLPPLFAGLETLSLGE